MATLYSKSLFLKYLIYFLVCYIITWKCLKKEKI
jgi:hypothetical protein